MASNPVTSGLQLWLDSRSLSLADNDAVAAWLDSSGQGNAAAQATAGRRPIYKTNIIGSNPVVRFAGGDDSLYGSFSAWGAAAGWTMLALVVNHVVASSADYGGIAVCHAGSGNDYGTTGGMTMEVGVGATTYRNLTTFTRVNASLFPNNTIAASSGQAAFPAPKQSAGVVHVAASASAYSAGLNGVQYSGSLSNTVAASTGYVIGNRYLSGAVSTTFGFAGDYGMVCIYNGLLSAANVSAVSAWMLQEFGIQPSLAPAPGDDQRQAISIQNLATGLTLSFALYDLDGIAVVGSSFTAAIPGPNAGDYQTVVTHPDTFAGGFYTVVDTAGPTELARVSIGPAPATETVTEAIVSGMPTISL